MVQPTANVFNLVVFVILVFFLDAPIKIGAFLPGFDKCVNEFGMFQQSHIIGIHVCLWANQTTNSFHSAVFGIDWKMIPLDIALNLLLGPINNRLQLDYASSTAPDTFIVEVFSE